MDIDFDELARKTFEISNNKDHIEILNREKENSPYNDQMISDIYEDISEEGLPLAPVGPGIVFRIDKGTHTFCIRGFSTPSIEQSLADIESGEVRSCQKLKINSDEDYDHINFFEFDTVELAHKVQQTLFNRRFPLDESLICNLSDPGFSWWLNDSEVGFEIFFQTYQIDSSKQLHKLGPLGDHYNAIELFRNTENILRNFFPINEFSVDDKSLKIIPCDPENSKFKELLNLLYRGDKAFLSTFFPVNDEQRHFLDYLKEISGLRLFWLNIEEILEDY